MTEPELELEKSNVTALEKYVPPQALRPVAMTPMDMLERAVSSGAGIEVIAKLMDLQERFDKTQARKAFDDAMASAKAEIPTIRKNREVDFTSQKGRTNYRHEDLAEVARTVDPVLAKHGLSYRFRTTSALGEPISVTCIVTHRLGHFEENTLIAPRDESGNKNAIQGIGSTVTYLQRYTLKAALGLAASNDTDGRKEETEFITEEQLKIISDLITETKTNLASFLKVMKAECLADIPASHFELAKGKLEQKKATMPKEPPPQ